MYTIRPRSAGVIGLTGPSHPDNPIANVAAAARIPHATRVRAVLTTG